MLLSVDGVTMHCDAPEGEGISESMPAFMGLSHPAWKTRMNQLSWCNVINPVLRPCCIKCQRNDEKAALGVSPSTTACLTG